MFKKFLVCLLVVSISLDSFVWAAEKYSSTDAINYAKKYAKNYNKNYPSYESDCTNYVSQCLVAGGMKVKKLPWDDVNVINVGRPYKTKTYWSCVYYKNDLFGVTLNSGWTPTTTWTVVDKENDAKYYGLQDHLSNNKGKVITDYKCTDANLDKLVSKAKIGDIVQYRKADSNRCTHSYIVAEKHKNKLLINDGYPNDIYFCAHTNTRQAYDIDGVHYLKKKGTIKKDDHLVLISMGK